MRKCMLMRWPFLLVVICPFSLSIQAQNKKITAETTVNQVTIFSSGAQGHRIANVSVPVGKSDINFPELSSQLQQQNVQLKADANITLMSVTTSKKFFIQRKIDRDEKNLLDRKEELKRKSEMDNKLIQVYKNEEQMLIRNESIGGQAGVNAEQLRQALDLHRQRLTEIYEKQIEIERRIKDELFGLAKVDSELADFSKKRDSIKYTVNALIDSKESRTIKFELVYTVKEAGWYPTYDVRVVDVQQPLSVLMNANVYQRSGETWNDVSIQLSSGNPTDNATPSKLQTWRIGYFDATINANNSIPAPGMLAGRIVDEKGTPVSYATVLEKGTSNGITADANGYFRWNNVNSNAVIVVSAIGYESKQITVKPGYYSIALNISRAELSEVVISGYKANSDVLEGAPRGYDRKQKKEEINTVAVITQYEPTNVLYKIEEKYS